MIFIVSVIMGGQSMISFLSNNSFGLKDAITAAVALYGAVLSTANFLVGRKQCEAEKPNLLINIYNESHYTETYNNTLRVAVTNRSHKAVYIKSVELSDPWDIEKSIGAVKFFREPPVPNQEAHYNTAYDIVWHDLVPIRQAAHGEVIMYDFEYHSVVMRLKEEPNFKEGFFISAIVTTTLGERFFAEPQNVKFDSYPD